VKHRHLLPEEIDLLLDGEVGFGVQPLRAHVRECAQCHAQLDEARAVATALEHLPHFAPSPLFVDRVMARVPVFVPWHVAAMDSVRRWVPQSRPARVLVGAMATSVAMVLTVSMLWLLTRLDLFMFFSGVALERTRSAFLESFGQTIAGMFGQPVLDALRDSGAAGIGIAVAALLLLVATTAFGLRALATASSRRH
jgi:hypothetical protein